MNNGKGKIVINIKLSLLLCFMYPIGDAVKNIDVPFISHNVVFKLFKGIPFKDFQQ